MCILCNRKLNSIQVYLDNPKCMTLHSNTVYILLLIYPQCGDEELVDLQ